MESGLSGNPNLELDNDAFQKFAFESHVPAYVGAGVLKLDFLDKTYILTTPDAKDLFSSLGMAQVEEMVKLQAQYYESHPKKAVEHVAKLTYQWPAIAQVLDAKGARELLRNVYIPIIPGLPEAGK